MLSNKKAFFSGLLIAPVLCLSLLGGLGSAQAGSPGEVADSLAGFIQPDNTAQIKITLPLPALSCQNRIMNVIAHQDDDLLFMNPDLLRGLNHGDCVQTVYLTAGDAGAGANYWSQREHGAEAAYSSMLKLPNNWQEKQVKLSGQWLINTATLSQAPSVNLVFIRLPDGNIAGQGFGSTNFESLQKLESGQIDKLHTVDGQASYSLDDLTALLAYLINQYQPDQIRAQANDYPDHSDHIAAGRLAAQAYEHYGSRFIPLKLITLNFYHGYMIGQLPQNVQGDELAQKQTAFLEYARYDMAVCGNLDLCTADPAYGSYLIRQYHSAE